jgi:hypothetical protein
VGSRLLAFTFLLIVFSLPAMAQMPGNPPQKPVQPPPMQPDLQPGPLMGTDDNGVADMQAALEKRAEKQRIEQLKSDTDKLLQLSVELKAYVDKSNTNVLSLDVMRKAEEIEKLAKSVHDKMRGPN